MALFFKAGDLINFNQIFFFCIFLETDTCIIQKLEFMIMIYDGLILKYRISELH